MTAPDVPDHVRAFHLQLHHISCCVHLHQGLLEGRLTDLYSHAMERAGDSRRALTVNVQTGVYEVQKPHAPLVQLIADRIIWGELKNDVLVLSDDRTTAFVDYTQGSARILLSEAGSAAAYVATHRLFPIALSELLRTRGVYYLHAAAVVSPEGSATIILGDSEAGKSTLTYAAMRDGLRYMADDGILFSIAEDGSAWIEPFYREFSLDPACMSEEDRARAVPNEPLHTGDSRSRLVPGPQLSAERAEVSSIVVVERTSGTSRLEPVAPSMVYEELLRQNPFVALVPELAAAHLRDLRRLLESARTFRALSGPDIVSEPGSARRLLVTCLGR